MSLRQHLRARFDFGPSLGQGGSGQVFEVRDRKNGAAYALKTFRVLGDGARERREIDASIRLDHPRILRSFEGGVEGDQAYLVMERAERSLEGILGKPDDLEQVWRYLQQAAEGVAWMHAQGMVHRDLKPGNLLIVEGALKIADLGLARDLDKETMTAEGMILGTPGYLSPEQARGERATTASDIFALGVLYYQALEGRLPYHSKEPLELMHEVSKGSIRDFVHAPSVLTPDLIESLRLALLPEPSDRPKNAETWSRSLGVPTNLGELSAIFQAPLRTGITPRLRRKSGIRPRRRNPSSILPAPSTRRIPRAQRQYVLPAVLLSGALVAGLLTGERNPSQREGANATAAEIAQETEDLQGLDPHLASRLRTILTDTQGMRINTSGELIAPELDLEGTLRDFPDPDPLAWEETVSLLAPLVEFQEWVSAGGLPERLPAALQDDMRRTDEYFERLAMPRPFSPSLGLAPEPSGEDPYRLLDGILAPEQRPSKSWLNTALRLLSTALTEENRFPAALFQGTPSREVPGYPTKFVHVWRRFQNPKIPDLRQYFVNYYAAHSERIAIQAYLRDGSEAVRAAHQCVRRGLVEEPQHSAALLALFSRVILALRHLWYSDLATSALINRDLQPKSPGTTMVAAAVLTSRSAAFRRVGSRSRAAELLAQSIDLYVEVAKAPAASLAEHWNQSLAAFQAASLARTTHDFPILLRVLREHQALIVADDERWFPMLEQLAHVLANPKVKCPERADLVRFLLERMEEDPRLDAPRLSGRDARVRQLLAVATTFSS